MLTSFAIALSMMDPVLIVAERCARAHETEKAIRAIVKVDTTSVYSREHTTYDLTYDRAGSADLLVKRKKPFRVVVSGDKVTEYDPLTKQYTEKVVGEEGGIEAKVKHSVGVLDELVASLMPEAGIRVWLKSLKIGDAWTLTPVADRYVLSASHGEDITRIEVDRETSLVRAVETKLGKYGTSWSFNYEKPAAIAFSPPQGAFKVGELTSEIIPPVYASAAAKKVCEKIFARYDKPRGLGYAVESDNEAFQVWIDQGKARQRDRHADWTVDKKSFSIVLFDSKSFASGPTDMTKLTDTIGVAGTRVEPLLKLALRGINPFRFYLGKNSRVTLKGSIKVDSEPCTILESASPDAKLSLIARDRDGFVLSIASIPKGTEATTMRRFKPIAVTQNTFAISKPEGWTVRSVDDLAGQVSKS